MSISTQPTSVTRNRAAEAKKNLVVLRSLPQSLQLRVLGLVERRWILLAHRGHLFQLPTAVHVFRQERVQTFTVSTKKQVLRSKQVQVRHKRNRQVQYAGKDLGRDVVIQHVFHRQEFPRKLSQDLATHCSVLGAEPAQPRFGGRVNRLPLTEDVAERFSCVGATELVIIETFSELHLLPFCPRDESLRTILCVVPCLFNLQNITSQICASASYRI